MLSFNNGVMEIRGNIPVINEDGSKDYVENDDSIIDMEQPSQEPAQPEPETHAPTQSEAAPMDAQAALFGNK